YSLQNFVVFAVEETTPPGGFFMPTFWSRLPVSAGAGSPELPMPLLNLLISLSSKTAHARNYAALSDSRST
ncbi:hypothetical protein, partial [Pseudomonas amygdali]|uniref:hypothetical protein n=1 Tax=Pseudomonas amygdali TaxID=47877 RepID=UPI001C827FA8